MSVPRPRWVHPAKRAALVRRIDVGWQDHALCSKFPADDWFPSPADSEAVAEVIEVCQRCPVRISCLAAALVVPEEHGIWGAATESDRRELVDALSRGATVPDVLHRSAKPTQYEGGEAA